ncbi:adenylosuccinate synthetase-like [Artemia franciscana]|uniref:Adenylosuccinate synthetase n=1 Tax=Artemia franciscana TaxID=6661 RepID=A0AA88HCV9_ARTSF|nr:hypothetical protein QYM36_016571 [Artemia franciscana]
MAKVNGMRDLKVDVVLGAQWGDEGKGKIVDLLAESADLCCRCQGGNNAGHTVVVEGQDYDFHLLPSGLAHKNCSALVGNGVVIHLDQFFDEIEKNVKKNLKIDNTNLFISDKAHIVFDFHQNVDGIQETQREKNSLGTTKKGIGPTYSSKASREGIRISDLIGDFDLFTERFRSIVKSFRAAHPSLTVDEDKELAKYRQHAEKIRPYVVESVSFLQDQIKAGKKVLIEGANAVMLDIDFGTYPFVTSSNCSIGGVLTGLGLPPRFIGNCYGVVKAYTTRVGIGPFPTEQINEIGQTLQEQGFEFGVTTGRRRRCGWLDLVVLRYSNLINGYTGLAITKLDILDTFHEIKVGVDYKLDGKILKSFPTSLSELTRVEVIYKTLPGWKTNISGIRKYSDLPENAKAYVQFIEDVLQVPVSWIGVGQSRDSIIQKA